MGAGSSEAVEVEMGVSYDCPPVRVRHRKVYCLPKALRSLILQVT